MRVVRLIAGAAGAVLLLSPAIAGAGVADVIEATYPAYSVSAPTPQAVFVCHGFGCKFRSEVDLGAADHARLAQILATGAGSPAAERRAVAEAWAWFDRRIAPTAGTRNHVASAGVEYMYDRRQFDCVDSSRNTTSLLLVLQQLKLLRYHTVDVPQSRGLLIDGRPPHYTAVLAEKGSGVKWAVDSWTRRYGQTAEVKPLARWLVE